MKVKVENNGSVLLIAIFAIALLAVLTMGILQMNTEEIQLMQNQIYAAGAWPPRKPASMTLSAKFELIQTGSPALPTRLLMAAHTTSTLQAPCRIAQSPRQAHRHRALSPESKLT